MELIILGLGASLVTVLAHLLEFIGQRHRRPMSTVAAAQTVLRRPAELRIKPRVVAIRPRIAKEREMSSERCA